MQNIQEDLRNRLKTLEAEKQELETRLAETEEALRAISSGEVDALVVYGENSERIYTLQGADYAYRVMVESIHEGAANIKADGTILYGNKRLAEMLGMPLERVLGSSFYNYLLPDDGDRFAALAMRGLESFGSAEFQMRGPGGSTTGVLVTASAAEVDGRRGICLVVTDLTEQKQAIERERELKNRLMVQREEERARIARNLHDGPLQELIGISFTLQEMETQQEALPGPEKIGSIRESIVGLARDLRGVCNELRPSNNVRFGLAKAIEYQSEELRVKHPDLTFHLELVDDRKILPLNVSTGLYFIFQECINNVIRHARASQVTVRLSIDDRTVRMEVADDGQGFQPPESWIDLARAGHLGLVGMQERAEILGGRVHLSSAPQRGTRVQAIIPLQQPAA